MPDSGDEGWTLEGENEMKGERWRARTRMTTRLQRHISNIIILLGLFIIIIRSVDILKKKCGFPLNKLIIKHGNFNTKHQHNRTKSHYLGGSNDRH
jgi:hypothetical protein